MCALVILRGKLNSVQVCWTHKVHRKFNRLPIEYFLMRSDGHRLDKGFGKLLFRDIESLRAIL